MKRRIVAILTALLLVTLLVAACGGDNGGTDPTPAPAPSTPSPAAPSPGTPAAPPPVDEYTGKTHLNWAHGAFPPSMDPTLINDMPGAQVRVLVYDTLLYFDSNMELQYGLATGYNFVDPQTVVLQIREGVQFHNGETLTAEDVAWSLTRAGQAPQVAAIANMIDKAEVTGANEVTLYLEFPFGPILAHIAHGATGILHKGTVERMGVEAHELAPVGTGPFMVTSMITGDSIELARNNNYWGNIPVLETISIRVIPDETMRSLELEAGAVDLISNVAFTDFERLSNNPDITTYVLPNLSTNFVGFNAQKAPFDDVRVRQAIAYAIDNEAILANVHRGLTTPVNGPIADSVWGSVAAELPGFPYNPDKARELLTEAGFPDGFSTTIWLNETVERQTIATIVQAQLRLVGVEVDIQVLEWGAYLDGTGAGEHDMFILGWVSVTGDPDYGLYPTYHTDSWGDAGNRARYSNERVDELIMTGRTSADQNVRLQAYAEAQRIIAEEVPTMWVNQGSERFATGAEWKGYVLHPAGYHSITTMFTD